MRHRLARRRAVVDAEIEPVRRVLLAQYPMRLVGEAQHLLPFRSRRLEERADVAPRDDEHVPGTYRMGVP